jgi:hypothetical protein
MMSNAGSKIRLVNRATRRVRDVNHPKDFVPPKLLKQKTTKPAIRTSEVYIMLIPV